MLFFAFIPLLFIEDSFSRKEKKGSFSFLCYSYLAFFLWNAITTWWIYYSTLFGMIGAVVINSLFMTTVFYFFHLTRNKLGNRQGYASLIVYWIAWEWWHMQWELSWPWLTLGNGFANYYKWIQWYEYTGVFGGSLWVLVINLLIYKLIKTNNSPLRLFKITSIGFLLLIPLLVSFLIYKNYEEKENPVNVVVVQPNVDPYNVKFNASPVEILDKMFSLAKPYLDSSSQYLVFPETALTENVWENEIDSSGTVLFINNFLKEYPALKIVTGASTYYAFSPSEKLSVSARKFKNQEGFYDAFNSALQIEPGRGVQVYHKSKLVVGVEKIPYPLLFKPLENFAINLGGTSGSLGTQQERSVFGLQVNEKEAIVAPVICYESIYGEYVTDYVKKGANVIFILTNDGWWENTPGHKQHLAYARLRAIETRRSIARSANTGISCFINQRGDIFQPTQWWEEAVITQKINLNRSVTFYVKYGDFIARISVIVTIFLFLWTIIRFIKNRFHHS